MYTFSFEKLDVWQETRKLIKDIYTYTLEYPENEKFGLVNQMRRAAVSVGSNIAEGTSRTSVKDQVYFYQISYGSLMELLNQAIISNDLEILSKENLLSIREKTEKIAKMLNSLRKKRTEK